MSVGTSNTFLLHPVYYIHRRSQVSSCHHSSSCCSSKNNNNNNNNNKFLTYRVGQKTGPLYILLVTN